jgi:hypothetical protein
MLIGESERANRAKELQQARHKKESLGITDASFSPFPPPSSSSVIV